MKKSGVGIFLAIFTYAAINTRLFAKEPYSQAFLAIDKPPSPEDWRFFMKAGSKWQHGLWLHYQKQNYTLADWDWSWRLAWVKACRNNKAEWCASLIQAGLRDDALVVRAAAAQAVGTKFAGDADDKTLGLLAQAYEHPGNLRHGKPLYIQRYILFAIRKLGGEQALKRGKLLAQRYPDTSQYWEKISNIH